MTSWRRSADAVAQYRAGKTASFGFLVGQVMKATAGKANPKLVNELLRREIDAHVTRRWRVRRCHVQHA